MRNCSFVSGAAGRGLPAANIEKAKAPKGPVTVIKSYGRKRCSTRIQNRNAEAHHCDLMHYRFRRQIKGDAFTWRLSEQHARAKCAITTVGVAMRCAPACPTRRESRMIDKSRRGLLLGSLVVLAVFSTSCAPVIETIYQPQAEGGHLVRSWCHGRAGPHDVLTFSLEEVRLEVQATPSTNEPCGALLEVMRMILSWT